MFSKALIVAVAATLVSAQTHTDCDPREKRCPAASALGKTANIDFTKSKGDEYLHTLDGTKVTYDGEKGAIFSIANEKQAPTKASDDYIFFGELHCDVQAAPGAGIVTSIVLQSDDLDEIDWEWIGNDNKQVQTNYFSKGDTSTWDRGGFHDVANPTGQFHSYGIVWSKEKIDWTIDGAIVRTLTAASAGNGKKFPQSPMQIKIGTWTAGRSDAPQGTIDWAGGKADFSDGPAIGYYKSCKIVDYMGGESAATEYAYPDGYDGSWQMIDIKNDGSKSDDDDEKTTTTTKTAAASATKSAESSADATSTETKTVTSAEASETTSVTVASSAAASESEAAETSSDAEEASSTAASSADATSEESTEESNEPSSGMMVKTNMALGAAALAAFLFL